MQSRPAPTPIHKENDRDVYAQSFPLEIKPKRLSLHHQHENFHELRTVDKLPDDDFYIAYRYKFSDVFLAHSHSHPNSRFLQLGFNFVYRSSPLLPYTHNVLLSKSGSCTAEYMNT